MKISLIIGMFLLTISFALFGFISNKHAYLGIVVLIGIGNLIFNAIPYSVVSLIISTEELGSNLGVLNCFGLGTIWPNNSRLMIAISSIPAFLGTISAFFVIAPRVTDLNEYNQIHDCSTTNEVSSSFISAEKF